MKIEEMVFECRCQKCGTPPIVISLGDLEYETGIPGALLVPENLRCVKCFAYMTTTVRKIRDDEKPKKE